MSALVKEIDWSKTGLGPVENWPQSLRTALSICFTSHSPILVWWHKEMYQFYNEPYRPVLGASKHPQAMGAPGPAIWPEIWHIMGPLFDKVFQGQSVHEQDQFMFLDRNGYLEETYFTHAHSPIRDESGEVAGVFTIVNETTEVIIQQRRLQSLHHLATCASDARTAQEAMQKSVQALAANPFDVPFALLYEIDEKSKHARQIETFGIANSSPADPFAADIEAFLAQEQDTEQLLALPEKTRLALQGQWGHDPVQAFLCPLFSSSTQQLCALLILGLNPHRPLDEGYHNFLDLIAGQTTTAIASATAYMVERKRAETLAELDRAKTVFFNNVSHEFRTPLTLSLGPLEATLADATHPLTSEQRANLEMVRRNQWRQLKLVNTLLDFSRIEAGRADINRQPTDLAQFTSDLASAFRSAIEKAGLRFLVDCPPHKEKVHIDRDMWEKIVLNLLSNALKYTFEGFIRVSLRLENETAELTVQDSGVGISADDLPHLFERFYRVHQSKARSYEGSGIGLALVQELVHMHGGTITIESTPGAGTTFVIRVPASEVHESEKEPFSPSLSDRADSYVEEALRWLPDEASQPVQQSEPRLPSVVVHQPESAAYSAAQPRPRVLVVDDNADMRDYLSRLLVPTYDVQLAQNGRQALALVQTNPPDLIISDVMMPEVNGFELLTILRSKPATAAIPFLMLSARAGEEATVQGIQAGANDYLTKPFSARELLARVQARLEISSLSQEAEIARQRMDTFLGIAGHELKNPLTSIKGNIQLARRYLRQVEREMPDLTASVRKRLETMGSMLTRAEHQVDFQNRLVGDLIDTSRIQAEKLEFRLSDSDLLTVIQEAVEEQRQLAPTRSILLEMPPDVSSLPLAIDADRIGQVVTNYLTNALKYSSADKPVTVRVKYLATAVQVEVTDQGQGLAPEQQQRIWQRFYRAPGVEVQSGSGIGLGLGLHICRAIIEYHGGQVGIESQPGQGSTFWFTLPLGNQEPV